MSKSLSLANPNGYRLRKELQELLAKFGDVHSSFRDMTEGRLESVAAEYQDLQEKMEKLEQELSEKERIAQLDLQLKIKSNKQEAMLQIANELGYALSKQEDYDAVLNEVEALKAKVASDDEELRNNLRKEYDRKVEAMKGAITSHHKAETAQLAANLEAARDKIDFLTSQLEEARRQLDVAQANTVKVAEAARPERQPPRYPEDRK